MDKAKEKKDSSELINKALVFFVNNAFSFTVGVMAFVHAVLMIERCPYALFFRE